MVTHSEIPTIIGRLLQEISWEGNARKYREGGRGYENVLTAEVLIALDFLPRVPFLNAVVESMHGADETRKLLIDEIEHSSLQLLPDDLLLNPEGRSKKKQAIVQPDGFLRSPNVFGFIETKRIRASSFQEHQVARELVATLKYAEGRTPLLFFILGKRPPFTVQHHGRCTIHEAAALCIDHVVNRETANFTLSPADVMDRIDSIAAWTTWNEIAEVLHAQARSFHPSDESVAAATRRILKYLDTVIAWHS